MKKIIALLLTLVLCASTFVGCGCNTTNDNTTDTTKNEIESTTDDKEDNTTSDSGNVGDITGEEDTSEEDTSVDDTNKNVTFDIYTFPTGDGFTEKLVATELDENADENWSYNKTYFINRDNIVMTFDWDGPAALGQRAWINELALVLSDVNSNYNLIAWTSGYVIGDYENCVNMSKETWTSFASPDVPYTGGYYNTEISDTTIEVTFAVEGDGFKGYNYYIIDTNLEICYQFAYREKTSIYDDARAWKVIESLEGISVEDFDTDEIKNFVE